MLLKNILTHFIDTVLINCKEKQSKNLVKNKNAFFFSNFIDVSSPKREPTLCLQNNNNINNSNICNTFLFLLEKKN